MAEKIALIVLDMHQSETSAMAQLLSLTGAGLPRKLTGAGPFNETGH
jgi:hypothetical protein